MNELVIDVSFLTGDTIMKKDLQKGFTILFGRIQ